MSARKIFLQKEKKCKIIAHKDDNNFANEYKNFNKTNKK